LSGHKQNALCVVACVAFLVSCNPASVSRIGPPVAPRRGDCEIEILDRGEKPSRPYRDVGMVALENCQDYRSLPCSEWLRRAACEVGGQVAYLLDEGRPDPQFQVGPVTFHVMVAAYAADLPMSLEIDPVYRSRTGGAPCEPDAGVKPKPEELGDGRCLE